MVSNSVMINKLITKTKHKTMKWKHIGNDSSVSFNAHYFITNHKYIKYVITTKFNYGFYDRVLVVYYYDDNNNNVSTLKYIYARKHTDLYDLITIIKKTLQ